MPEFDDRLSAYLDDKLSASERAEFEKELQRNPDLRESLERLRKLHDLARQAPSQMPAEGYFDSLAERIDSRLAREERPKRGFALLQPIMPKSKVIAILSSVAAVFLIVVVVNQVFKPASERYTVPKTIIVNPPEERKKQTSGEMQPAIQRKPLPEGADRYQIVKELPDTTRGKTVQGERIPEPVPDSEYKEPPVFPEHREARPTMAIPQQAQPSVVQPADTIRRLLSAEPNRSETAATIVAPAGAGKPTSEPKALSSGLSQYSRSAKIPVNDSSKGALKEAEKPAERAVPYSFDDLKKNADAAARQYQAITAPPAAARMNVGPSIPLAIDSVETGLPKLEIQKRKFAETFDPAEYELRVQAMLDSGKYVPVVFQAWDTGKYARTTSQYDAERGSLTDWYDSLQVMAPEQWQAENAYREAMRSRRNRLADCITARLYIQHYLESGAARDTNLWQSRLSEVQTVENAERDRLERGRK